MIQLKRFLTDDSAGVIDIPTPHFDDFDMGLMDHHPVIIIGHGKTALLSHEHLKQQGVNIVERLPTPKLVIPIIARDYDHLMECDTVLREQIRVSKHRRQKRSSWDYKKYKFKRRLKKLARKINWKRK